MGVDGSGKTTLSNLFIHKMQENEIEFNYIWCKFGSYNQLLRNLLTKMSFLIIKKNRKTSDFPGKKEIKQNGFSRVYLYFILILHYLDILVKVKVPIVLGKNVACDRYLTDTIVDLALEFNYSYNDAIKLVNSLYFTPKPDILFYISIPVNLAYERKKENSIDYLKRKEEIYNKYSREHQVVKLDGTKKLDELVSEVQDYFMNR